MDESHRECGVRVMFGVYLHELQNRVKRRGTDVEIFGYGGEMSEGRVSGWAVKDYHNGVKKHAIRRQSPTKL